jgi:hypothetical protein
MSPVLFLRRLLASATLVLFSSIHALAAQASPTAVSRVAASVAKTPSAVATTADFAWLAGNWEGNLAGDGGVVAALTFQAPAAGTITGVMRLRQGDKLLMVELIAMVDTPRGVEMRFRHFTGTLEALEPTFKHTMLLKSHEPTKDTFENLADYDKTLMSTQPRVSAWIRRGPDEMVAHSDIIGGDGKPAVIEVIYRRTK